jgi:hypothetical protein
MFVRFDRHQVIFSEAALPQTRLVNVFISTTVQGGYYQLSVQPYALLLNDQMSVVRAYHPPYYQPSFRVLPRRDHISTKGKERKQSCV